MFRLQAGTLDQKLFWTSLAWVGIVLIPLGWILFALEYTGRHDYLAKRFITALSVIPATTIVVVASSSFHDLLTVTTVSYTPSGILQVTFGGPWFWIVTIFTYALGVGGILLLLELILNKAFTFRKQAITLTIGLVVPWSTNILYITGIIPHFGIDPTPIAFSISGVLYLFAIKRFRLLRQNPAPNRQARQLVFDRMQEGAVVVDGDDNIVEVNQRALQILDTDRQTIHGHSAAEVIPQYDEMPPEGIFDEYVALETEAGTHQLEFEATRIRTEQGNQVGRVITFSDVTTLLHHQQRLEVLNRVLRHNIRTETNLILGFAESVPDEQADRIKHHARRIEAFGEKGRSAVNLFDQARKGSETRKLDTIISGNISYVRDDFPEVTISYWDVDPNVRVENYLEIVIRNVIENAAKHNSNAPPKIWISTATSNGSVTINIADNGPGIEDYELSVLEKGSESSLEHGSGFGLWIVKWGVDLVNGSVSFRDRTPTGTVVTLQVPSLGAE